MEAPYLLGRAAVFSAVAALAMLLWAGGISPDSPGRKKLSRYLRRLDEQLEFIRSRRSGRQIAMMQLLGSAACLILVARSSGWYLCALPILFWAPSVLLGFLVSQRVTRFESQIEGWLVTVSNSLKASPSLGEAISSTVPLVPNPMSQEIDLVVKEYELGTPLDEALDHLAERIESSTLSAMVLALKVARRSGGNLPEMLTSAADALRELARLEGVVRTKTAEGRAQTWVIGAIPVPMVLLLRAIDPKFFEPLFAYTKGHFVIAVAVVLWVCAIFAARWALHVDV